MNPAVALLGDRLSSRVRIAPSGCWVWCGALHRDGYGWTRPRFGTQLAHRIAYTLAYGPVPAGLELDHICRQRACINPEHLEAVTTRTNVRRGVGPAAINARKTACPKGHPYDRSNTVVRVIGGRSKRFCRACAQERVRV